MQRALRTAGIAGFDNPVVTPLLREFDYGDYEGLTRREILESSPGWDLYRDGCPGGETSSQVYDRARAFVDLAGKNHGRVLAFAHGHILRAIAVAWVGLGIEVAGALQLDVATLSILSDSERGRVLQMWNAP
jgi:broad specificity phosphatase PhoE